MADAKDVMLHVFVVGNSNFQFMSNLSSAIVCVLNYIEIDSASLGFLSGYNLDGVNWDFSFTFVVKLTYIKLNTNFLNNSHSG